MKKVILRRIVDGKTIEEVFEGPKIGWTVENGVFRVWTDTETVMVPLDKVEVVIVH